MFLVVESEVEAGVRVNFSKGTTDDHTGQEETGWNLSTVGNDGPKVPDAAEYYNLTERAKDTLTQNVPDKATFRLPEETDEWVELSIVMAPSLVNTSDLF